MAGNKYLTIIAGIRTLMSSNQVSAGAGDAGKLVALNSSGQVDTTMLPSSIGQTTRSVVASAAISAGAMVNIYNNAGTMNARPADNSAVGQEANAYAPSAVSSGATGTFNLAGVNAALSGLTAGSQYYLGTVGAIILGASLPTATGTQIQAVGKALSTTELEFDPDYPATQ